MLFRSGMVEVAPFEAIVMTAAATHVPRELLDQIAVGGRMIFPMTQKGDKRGEQRLCVVERTAHGFVEKKLDVVKFVPMLPGVA